MIRKLGMGSALAALALTCVLAGTSSAADASDPWAKGAQWMSIRAGYAKLTGKASADGGAGYGFGYSRMLNKRYSLGFYAHHELLSKSNAASEMAFPFTLELVHHYDWHTATRPYVGLGGGGFNLRTTRSGDDGIHPSTGLYLVTGVNSPVARHQLLGIDARFARVHTTPQYQNPVFGYQHSDVFIVSLKLNWSYTY